MGKIKDSAYDFLVRKNSRVRYEYERYVRENIKEHYESHGKHWKILLKLNWHYRVKKCSQPMLYWDEENAAAEDRFEAAEPGGSLRAAPRVKAQPNGSHAKTAQEKNQERTQEKNQEKTQEKKAAEKQISDKGALNKENPYPESLFAVRRERASPVSLARKLLTYDVISFDIFDTLVYRPFDRPEDLFYLLERKLKIINFAKLRQEAEKKARESAVNREVDIYDIYKEMPGNLQAGIEDYIREEIGMEYHLCYANEYMKRVFDILAMNGKDIILISNMYLPEREIERMLEKCGFTRYRRIFISNVYKRNKATENLYRFVDGAYVKGRKAIHCGDNVELDVQKPKKIGWDSVHIPGSVSVARRYRRNGDKSLVSSIYCGIVGNMLQNGMSVVKGFDSFWEFGFAYGGILVLGFCGYIQKVCRENGIDRIIFLGRDGDILQKAAKKYFGGMAGCYVPWSRFMGICANSGRGIEELFDRAVKPLKGLLRGADVGDALGTADCVFLKKYLKDYGLEEKDLLNVSTEQKLYSLLKAHEAEIVEYYRRGDGLAESMYGPAVLGAERIAVVDIGWTGGSIEAFRRYITDKLGFGGKCIGIVCGCFDRDSVNLQISSGDLYSYLFAYNKNRDLMERFTRNNFNYTMIMETLFTEAAPSILRTDAEMVKYAVPVVENYGKIAHMQRGILDFMEIFLEKFGPYQDLFEISGYDAYLPLEHFMENGEWVKTQFEGYLFNSSMGFQGRITEFNQNLKGV